MTTKFWFTHSSGKLEIGTKVEWHWEMYNVSVPVEVKEIEKNLKVIILWGSEMQESEVSFSFEAIDDNKTLVKIENYNFKGTEEEVINKIIDSTGGFNLMLAGMKFFLEHGIELNLVADKVPN